jgi:hypothetical protein
MGMSPVPRGVAESGVTGGGAGIKFGWPLEASDILRYFNRGIGKAAHTIKYCTGIGAESLGYMQTQSEQQKEHHEVPDTKSTLVHS